MAVAVVAEEEEEDAAEAEVEVKVKIIEDKVMEIRNSSVVDNMTESIYGQSVQPTGRVTHIGESMDEVKEEAKAKVEMENTINRIMHTVISYLLLLLKNKEINYYLLQCCQ